ncbi:hypothetical protein MESS4_130005 [Mesorhizobium sp. STM 4661]|nr:hypothetical protein MESS4_130005 [Mesorhizobium sp. STM 4661]
MRVRPLPSRKTTLAVSAVCPPVITHRQDTVESKANARISFLESCKGLLVFAYREALAITFQWPAFDIDYEVIAVPWLLYRLFCLISIRNVWPKNVGAHDRHMFKSELSEVLRSTFEKQILEHPEFCGLSGRGHADKHCNQPCSEYAIWVTHAAAMGTATA